MMETSTIVSIVFGISDLIIILGAGYFGFVAKTNVRLTKLECRILYWPGRKGVCMLEVIKQIPGHNLGFLGVQKIKQGSITDEGADSVISTIGGWQIRLSDEVVVVVMPEKIYIIKEIS